MITGGKAEADAAYEEAMEAVFSLQLDQYSHVQYYETPQTAGQLKRRWDLIELWPLQVCQQDLPPCIVPLPCF